MKKTLALVLALVLALSLCACGGGGTTNSIVDAANQQQQPQQTTDPKPLTPDPTEAPEPAKDDSVVGYYKATSILGDDGNGGTFDMVALLEAFGVKTFLVLNEDGTGCIDSAGEQSPLRWEGSHLIVENDDGETEEPEFTYANGVITFEADDSTMTFTKLTEEELADYLENGSGSVSWGTDEIPEGDPSTGPVTGTISGCGVTVLGAEALEDDDGNPLMRVYYEFTNDTDDFLSPYGELYNAGWQDGERCDMGYTYDNAVPEDDYDYLSVLPGKTIRCSYLFKYDPEGGTICFHISDLWDDDNIYYYIDPANVFGAPTAPFEFTTDPAIPDFLKELPLENDSLLIWDFERTTSYFDEPLLRIYTEYSNLGEEATSFYMEHSVYAFQDGYGLETGYAKDDVEEDDNVYTDVDPEDWIDVAHCFVLRSDSPVVFVIENDDSGERVALVIEDVNSTMGTVYMISSVSGITMEQYAALTGITLEEARRMMVITLFPDGSAIFANDDDSYEVEWTVTGEVFKIMVEGEEVLSGTLVGDEITINAEDAVIVLTKVT